MKTLIAFLLLASSAQAAPWPIIYTESSMATVLPDAWRPWPLSESKIVRLDPDGDRTVLVDPGPGGAAWDHKVSLDGKWMYYAVAPSLGLTPFQSPTRPTLGSDIWRMNLETGFKQQITFGEQEPYVGRNRIWGLKTWNMGPCPLPGGERIMFTSDREVLGQNQLWTCDLDGKNVEKVGFLNVSNALHPVVLSNGRVLFSSLENQGTRNYITWGLWSILPDGRDFEPFFSAYFWQTALHWHNEASNRQVFTTAYYVNNNDGFGSLFGAPLDFPGYEHQTPVPPANLVLGAKMFRPKGSYELTPWTTWNDNAAPLGTDGVARVGKLSHPAACPDPTKMLVSYSAGPANRLERPTNQPGLNSGIYLIPIGQPTAGPESLVKVVDDPAVHEWQAEALLPYSEIFGSDPFGSLPVKTPWLPNAGSENLPAGTPYGLVGTSSLYVRETDAVMALGWKEPLGGNSSPFANSEIAYLRILTTEWVTTELNQPPGGYRTALSGDERLRILGEIDVRRFDQAGSRINDPAGNPDTSFLAKIRADEPFLFQILDQHGKSLTTAQTWHHVRPGERKYDCRGCHAHTQPEVRFDFEASWAAKNLPADMTLEKGRLIEYYRDVKPILLTRGVTEPPISDWNNRNYKEAIVGSWQPYESKAAPLMAALVAANGTAAEVRTLAEWIDTGGLLDKGEAFRDDTKPTLFVHSPRPRTQPITQIVIGAADADLDAATLTVTLDGRPVAMTGGQEGIWTATVPVTASGELVAWVKDKSGNVTGHRRTFTVGVDGPPPVPPPTRVPTAIYVGLDGDNVGPERQGTPDGKPDHHVKLTGLSPAYNRVNVHGNDASGVRQNWSNEAEIPLVLGRPSIPGSPSGVLDLWFAPRGTEATQEFTVFIRHPDGTEDRIVTTLPPVGDCEQELSALRAQIATLQGKATADAATITELKGRVAALTNKIEAAKAALTGEEITTVKQ